MGRPLVVTALAALLVSGALLGAACGGGVNEAEDSLAEVQAQLSSAELDPFRLTTSRAPFLPDPPEGMITVKIDFEISGIPGRIDVYQPAGAADRLFAMESLEAGEEIPRGDLIEDGILFAPPGELGLVEFVYENPTDEEVSFMAVAPTFDPVAAHPFAYARCFCAAIKFTAPPGGAWYRTIAIGTAPQVEPGTKAIVTWPVMQFIPGESVSAEVSP